MKIQYEVERLRANEKFNELCKRTGEDFSLKRMEKIWKESLKWHRSGSIPKYVWNQWVPKDFYINVLEVGLARELGPWIELDLSVASVRRGQRG